MKIRDVLFGHAMRYFFNFMERFLLFYIFYNYNSIVEGDLKMVFLIKDKR